MEIKEYDAKLREILALIAVDSSISKTSDILNYFQRLNNVRIEKSLSTHTIVKALVELGLASLLAVLYYVSTSFSNIQSKGFHFDDTSKFKFSRDYFGLNLVVVDQLGGMIEVPLDVDELKIHQKGVDIADKLEMSIKYINSLLKLLNREPWDMYSFQYLTCDNASVNTGNCKGAMKEFEERRKKEYTQKHGEEKNYIPLIFQTCQNHAIHLYQQN